MDSNKKTAYNEFLSTVHHKVSYAPNTKMYKVKGRTINSMTGLGELGCSKTMAERELDEERIDSMSEWFKQYGKPKRSTGAMVSKFLKDGRMMGGALTLQGNPSARGMAKSMYGETRMTGTRTRHKKDTSVDQLAKVRALLAAEAEKERREEEEEDRREEAELMRKREEA